MNIPPLEPQSIYFVPNTGGAVSTTASAAVAEPVFVRPPTPDQAIHPPERKAAAITLRPHPENPAWVPPGSHNHPALPIEAVIFAASLLAIAAWHVTQARLVGSAQLIR